MTDLNAMLDSVLKSAAEYETKMKEEAKTIFATVVESMKEHPSVFLQWEQYTPYFNDGEECTFSVHDINVFGVDEDGCEIGERYDGISSTFIQEALTYRTTGTVHVDDWSVKYYGEEKARNMKTTGFAIFRDMTNEQLEALSASVAFAEELAAKLQQLPDDIFRNAFGDHVQVKLNGEGAVAEEYSHD